MEAGLETATDKAADLTHFIERARQVTRLTELTPEIAHEVIEKIVVFKPEKAGATGGYLLQDRWPVVCTVPGGNGEIVSEYLAKQRKKTA